MEDAGELLDKGTEEVKKSGILDKIKGFFGLNKEAK